jgi:hypothetical protein
LKLNAEQRKHIAGSLQTVALGQLAFFGYRSVEQFHYGWILGSLILAAVLEAAAIFVLRVEGP